MRFALQPSALLTRALLLVGAGAGLGLVVSALRPGGLELGARPAATSCEAPQVEPTLLSPTEAAGLCARERALIVDARAASEFAVGHIASARHLPCDASGALAGEALRHLEDRSLVLVYGAGTAEALAVARSIARHLPAAGTPRVYALSGGFAAWERAGLACASGPCEGCAVHSSTRPGGP